MNTLLKVMGLLFLGITVAACPPPVSGGGGNGGDRTPPGPVTNVMAVPGQNSVILRWTNPTDEDFDHVQITYGQDPSDLDDWDGETNPTGTLIDGLENTIEYRFVLTAFDQTGNPSSVVTALATPSSLPDISAPGEITNLRAIAGMGSVVLIWTPPDDNDLVGFQIQYEVTGSEAQEYLDPIDPNGTSITGLENGTEYIFSVRAFDEVPNYSDWVSVSSTPSSVEDILPPLEVTNLSSLAGNQQVSLSWIPPADSDLVGHRIFYGTNGTTDRQWQGPIDPEGTVITALENDQEYTFLVQTYDEVPNVSAGVLTTSTPSQSQQGGLGLTVTVQNEEEPALNWQLTGNISGTLLDNNLSSTRGSGDLSIEVSPVAGTITDYSWRINGQELGTESNLVLSPDSHPSGPNHLSLVFVMGGTTFSQFITLTIVN